MHVVSEISDIRYLRFLISDMPVVRYISDIRSDLTYLTSDMYYITCSVMHIRCSVMHISDIRSDFRSLISVRISDFRHLISDM